MINYFSLLSLVYSFALFSCPTKDLEVAAKNWRIAYQQVYLARTQISDTQRNMVSQWLQIFQKCAQEVIGSEIKIEVMQRYLNGFVEQLEDPSSTTDCLLFNPIKENYFNVPEYVYFKKVIKQSIMDLSFESEKNNLRETYGDSCEQVIMDAESEINAFSTGLESEFLSKQMLNDGNVTISGCPAGFLQNTARKWIAIHEELWAARKEINQENQKTVQFWLDQFSICTNQFIGRGVAKKAMAEYLRTIVTGLKSLFGSIVDCPELNLVKSENFETPNFRYFRAIIQQSLADVEQELAYSLVSKQFGSVCAGTIEALQGWIRQKSAELESKFTQDNT
jgi:hypothetical protein